MTPPATLSSGPATYPMPYAEVLEAAHPPLARAGTEVKSATRRAPAPAPQTYTRILLVATLLGATFRNYWTYSHNEHQDPSIWMSFVNGTGAAPEQYRVGVKVIAWWIMRHIGGGFRHSYALMDIVASTLAGLLLYALLERSRVYRGADALGRWLGSMLFLALFFYYLSWLPWFEKAETLPSAGLVAGLLWLWTRPPEIKSGYASGYASGQSFRRRPATLRMAALLLLTVAQALVRADIACMVNAGVLVLALTSRFGSGFSLRRPLAVATSGAGVLLAVGTQLYMMRIAYPHASYGDTPVFMLRYDLFDPLVAGPFVLFLLPFAWTAYEAARWLRTRGDHGRVVAKTDPDTGVTTKRRQRDEGAASLALLLGGLLYLPLWMTLGKLDEVRIFMPFALALVPLTSELLLRRVSGRAEDRPGISDDHTLNHKRDAWRDSLAEVPGALT